VHLALGQIVADISGFWKHYCSVESTLIDPVYSEIYALGIASFVTMQLLRAFEGVADHPVGTTDFVFLGAPRRLIGKRLRDGYASSRKGVMPRHERGANCRHSQY